MRNYIILNNQRSDEISGLIIQELAPISKPLQRTQVETIDGRDGDIVTPLGYAAYDKKITIGLYGDFDINEIIAYFATQGTAIFSNEPDKYYNYQILDQIDYERLVRFRVATVTMHVQPFKYSATEGTLTIDASDTVSGEGSEIALDSTAEAPFNVLRYKGNTTQNGTPTPSAPVPVQIVTGRQTVMVAGKNLFNATGGTTTVNGVTFTKNADGTYTANGTATSFIGYTIGKVTFTSATSVIYSGCPANGSMGTYSLNLQKDDGAVWLVDETGSGQTATLEANKAYSVRLVIRQGTTANGIVYKPMVRLSSVSDATYEPYNGQNYEINLGKNLWGGFANDFSKSSSGITFVAKTDGTITNTAGTTSATAYSAFASEATSNGLTKTLEAGTYCISGASGDITLDVCDTSGTTLVTDSGNGATLTLSAKKTVFVRVRVASGKTLTAGTTKPQLEKGSTASSYAPYFTPIGLAAIGDYVDEPVKVGDTWYIRRAVGKVVFDGSENWQVIAGASITSYGLDNALSGDYHSDATATYLANNFKTISVNDRYVDNTLFINALHRVVCTVSSITSLASFKTWLASNNVTVYYVLATPTDEEITDQALIDALDDFYEQAHAYKGRTHITATAQGDNAPAVLAVEVGEDNESTVTNAGNTTSRPILTIYGQGDIGVYINDVEVLDIALGDEQYITIDSVAMEAYKGTTANLKNRLVTGDYSKLALNAGNNTIYFTGKVTKYEISKYSRWL